MSDKWPEDDPPPPVADPASGEVRILAARCRSCILNPRATRIPLAPGRLRQFLAQAQDGHVVCHRTLPGLAPPGVNTAICRGHADAFGLPPLVRWVLAQGVGRLVEQPDHDGT